MEVDFNSTSKHCIMNVLFHYFFKGYIMSVQLTHMVFPWQCYLHHPEQLIHMVFPWQCYLHNPF